MEMSNNTGNAIAGVPIFGKQSKRFAPGIPTANIEAVPRPVNAVKRYSSSSGKSLDTYQKVLKNF
jgi:hypothetical protein